MIIKKDFYHSVTMVKVLFFTFAINRAGANCTVLTTPADTAKAAKTTPFYCNII